jgi:hypothetical protein
VGGCVDHGENVDGWGSGCDPSIRSGSCRRWDAGVAVGRGKRNAGKQHVSNNKNPCPPSLHFQRLLQHHSRRLLTRTSPELVLTPPHMSHVSLWPLPLVCSTRRSVLLTLSPRACTSTHSIRVIVHSLTLLTTSHHSRALLTSTSTPSLFRFLLHPQQRTPWWCTHHFLPHPQHRTPWWCTHHATTNRAASRRGSRTCTACRRS